MYLEWSPVTGWPSRPASYIGSVEWVSTSHRGAPPPADVKSGDYWHQQRYDDDNIKTIGEILRGY